MRERDERFRFTMIIVTFLVFSLTGCSLGNNQYRLNKRNISPATTFGKECESRYNYKMGCGPLKVGMNVLLTNRGVTGIRNRSDNSENWNSGMNQYVGKKTTITELSGTDDWGYCGVRVEIDNGHYFWRATYLDIVEQRTSRQHRIHIYDISAHSKEAKGSFNAKIQFLAEDHARLIMSGGGDPIDLRVEYSGKCNARMYATLPSGNSMNWELSFARDESIIYGHVFFKGSNMTRYEFSGNLVQ